MPGKPNIRLPEDQLVSLVAAILLSRGEDPRLSTGELEEAVTNARDILRFAEAP
jgi:hypothetical protein